MRGVKIRNQAKTKKTKSGTVSIATGSKGNKLKQEMKEGKKAVKKMWNKTKKAARKSGVSTKGKMKPTYFKG